jgi:hypothetical protein
MIFKIGTLSLGENPDGPDPGPKNADWHMAHVVEVKPIPGKGKKFITVRTSDKHTPTTGPLYECDLTVRSISDQRYKDLKILCEDGGPFEVSCNHGLLKMYIIDFSINHAENDKEPPLKIDDGTDSLNVATWTIKLQEVFDGKTT